MSLAERLKEAQANSKPVFERWLETIDEEDRKALIHAAGDPNLPTKKLIAIVRSEGISVGEERFKEWRQGHGFPG